MLFSYTPQFFKDVDKLKKENPKLNGKVLLLIKEIEKYENEPLQGNGKPELLKGNLAGCYSRRIDQKHRLIYKIDILNMANGEEKLCTCISCYGHYNDK